VINDLLLQQQDQRLMYMYMNQSFVGVEPILLGETSTILPTKL
jgi:hypothetical protein